MGKFDAVKTSINANIRKNGNQEITGEVMNSVLRSMVDATDKALTEELVPVAESLSRLDEEKVSKVFGKGLSANDYTDAEKQKLASLQNYDDAGVIAEIGRVDDAQLETASNVITLGAELTELSEEVGKKADADGTYLDFTAGRSIDMLGVHEGDDSEFLFRPTDGEGSIKDGKAVIERIEGNSVVWNQIAKDLSLADGIPTAAQFEDGKAVLNNWISYDPFKFNAAVKARIGHRILLFFSYTNDSSNPRIDIEIGGSERMLFVKNGEDSVNFYTITNATIDAINVFPISDQQNVVINHFLVYDLTKMFGAGNEPLTIEEFNQRIPQGIDINAYNEGEIVDMRAEGIKSVGFNQWKAQPILSSAEYGQNYVMYLENNADALESLKTIYTLLADGHNVYYSAKVEGTAVGVPIGSMALFSNGAVLGEMIFPNAVNEASRFANIDRQTIADAQSIILYATHSSDWSVSDICISLVHTGYRNGEYEPYVSEEIALPTMTYFPNGMRSIGKVCDEITQKQTIQRIAVRDFQEGDLENSKVLTDGEKTYYELAEPIVTDIEPILLEYDAYDFGTEQVIASGKCAPLKASIVYGFNARDTIRNNRESIEELTRRITILEQMVSAMAAQAQAANFVE